jgi:hypothetical protein
MPSLSNGEIIKAFNAFYAIPEKLNPPIFFAMRIIAQRVNGEAESEIQKEIEYTLEVNPTKAHVEPTPRVTTPDEPAPGKFFGL